MSLFQICSSLSWFMVFLIFSSCCWSWCTYRSRWLFWLLLTHWPSGMWLYFQISYFQTRNKDRCYEHFLWNCPLVNATRHHKWFTIGPGNGLVPSLMIIIRYQLDAWWYQIIRTWSQWWHKSIVAYGATRSHWVNALKKNHAILTSHRQPIFLSPNIWQPN